MRSHLYNHQTPELSVVLVASRSFEGVALTIAHLRAQKGQEKIELVLVTSSREILELPTDEVEGFAAVQIVEIESLTTLGRGNAAGVRAATASLIVLTEDHAFPEEGWAQALIEAHYGPWSVVGPVVSNFNPDSAVSQADFMIGYGLWDASTHKIGQEVDLLPGHHSCYKREVLLELGPELEAMLETETVLHWLLHSQGHRLWLEPKARIGHINFSSWKSLLPLYFYLGRSFGASRVREWNYARRLLFVLASTLIPLVRLKRLSGSLRQYPRPATLLTLLLMLTTDAIGQCCGYLTGNGFVPPWLHQMEFERTRYLCQQDQETLRSMNSAFRKAHSTI